MIAALLIALLPVGQPIVPVDRPPVQQRAPQPPWRVMSRKEVLFRQRGSRLG